MAGESNQTFQWMGRIALIVMACLSIPLGLGCFVTACAEAFTGNKQPLFLVGAAMLASIVVGNFFLATWVALVRGGDRRKADLYAASVLLVGISMWWIAVLLIRVAYTFPDHRIPW
tara:strand:- start:409 stop:756 length:348 start_codon:yes stop_codon:yes gene_type:complete